MFLLLAGQTRGYRGLGDYHGGSSPDEGSKGKVVKYGHCMN